MGIVRLHLRKERPDKKGQCGLYLRYSHEEYVPALISLGTNFKLDPQYFNFEKHEIRKNFFHKTKYDLQIGSFKSMIQDVIQELELRRITPEPALVKDLFLNKRSIDKYETTFWDAYEYFITQGKGDRGETTLKKFHSLKVRLREFEGHKVTIGGEKSSFGEMQWSKVTYEFFQRFKDFLIHKRLTANTVGRYIKNLKTFMAWAQRMKYHNIYDYRDFKAPSAEPATFALEEHELLKLIAFDAPGERLQRIKNMFLLQIYLGGLRYSDLINLIRSSFRNQEEFLEINSKKVKRHHIIPITDKARELLSELDTGEEYLIRRISVDKYNQYLKELFEKAGLDRPIRKVHYIGKEEVQKVMPLYEAASSHLARRTTITLLSTDTELPVIQKVAGQTDLKTTQGYIRLPSRMVTEALEGLSKKLNGAALPT